MNDATPKPEPADLPQEIADFHRHLDQCARCREQPFSLCHKGEKLLWQAAMQVDEQPQRTSSDRPRVLNQYYSL